MVRIAEELLEATFILRENRFVGIIKIDDRQEKCHIMNPGRMIHFLIPGAKILVADRAKKTRKLRYSLIYVVISESLILIDSQVPNSIVHEALLNQQIPNFNLCRNIRREVPYGRMMKSRIDFLLDNHIYLEVKATNYEENGIGYFPDAPTKRGQKHVQELIELQCDKTRVETYILFLAQRIDIREIRPFTQIDPDFTNLLKQAKKIGTKLLGYSIKFSDYGCNVEIGNQIPVVL